MLGAHLLVWLCCFNRSSAWRIMTQRINPRRNRIECKTCIKHLSGEEHCFMDEGQGCGGKCHILLVAKSSWLILSTWSMNSLRALFILLFTFIEKDIFFSVLLCTVLYILRTGRMFVLLMNIGNWCFHKIWSSTFRFSWNDYLDTGIPW